MKGDDGSASVVAVAMIGALMVLALCLADLARVEVISARAQTAADAAALAAAQELAIPGDRAPSDVATEYAARNGAEVRSCRCAAGTFEATVEVRVAVGHLFVFGEERVVDASARAVVDLDGQAG